MTHPLVSHNHTNTHINDFCYFHHLMVILCNRKICKTVVLATNFCPYSSIAKNIKQLSTHNLSALDAHPSDTEHTVSSHVIN